MQYNILDLGSATKEVLVTAETKSCRNDFSRTLILIPMYEMSYDMMAP